MAASSTVIRRKAIDAATQAARRAAIARREERVQAMEAAYEAAADQVSDWLQQHADGNGRVSPEALGAFDQFMEVILRQLRQELAMTLHAGLSEAAASAAAVFVDGTAIDGVVQRALQQVNDFIAADGLQLSDRLWRVGQATHNALADTIRGAVLRGESATQAARQLLAEGRAVPVETALQARQAQAAVLGRATTATMLQATGNPLRNVLRVLRTEINRAFTESFVATAVEHPDVAAVKFNLSPLHPRPDICDLYANANLHGMGAGVYPAGAHPYPAHPETLSYLTVVFHDEIGEPEREGRQSAFDWLRGRSRSEQDAVLGQHKADAFRAGQLNDDELLATWRQVRARLEASP